ncbi:MAG: nitroreductase/quinone reductase family protein, partial [Propionibacteriaceae bacterium]
MERYQRTGVREADTLADTGHPVVILTTRGNKSDKLRKTPLIRRSGRRSWPRAGSPSATNATRDTRTRDARSAESRKRSSLAPKGSPSKT